jgi:hypothetical protein
MVILDLWGISFHPAVVVGLGNDLLFNSILAHCVLMSNFFGNLNRGNFSKHLKESRNLSRRERLSEF